MTSSINIRRTHARIFLTAEWHLLLMLNYEVDPQLLKPIIPYGTELDFWNGQTFISVVGFLFLNTRVLGVRFPFHTNFEEVNLRFYVRRKTEDGWKRGVTFIREIVPRRAVALIANALYNERYIALPMQHCINDECVEYSWQSNGQRQYARAESLSSWRDLEVGSQEEFIAEHYWGYATQRDGGTVEYQVEHPRWRVRNVHKSTFDCDVAALYGAKYSEYLTGNPASAFIADGSPVSVYRGIRI